MAVSETQTTLDLGALLPAATHLIGGEWVASHTGETIDVINPATGETLAAVPRGSAEDVADAVAAAAEAYPAWRDTSPSVRGQLLLRWAELCREHGAELDLLERMEVGRPSWGPAPMPGIITFVAGLADKATGQTLPSMFPDVVGMTLREPWGVCASIIPWNAPGPTHRPGVGAGDRHGQHAGAQARRGRAADAAADGQAGARGRHPARGDQRRHRLRRRGGQRASHHPGIRKMSFTGSPETGTRIMQACAENLVPVHLELGGKSPQVVLRDAPLEKAIPTIVRSITLNTGRSAPPARAWWWTRAIRDQVVEGLADGFAKSRWAPGTSRWTWAR